MILFNFDAIALPSDTLGTRQPSTEGRRLWDTLFQKYMGRTLVVVDSQYKLELVKEWLKRENFKVSAIHQTPVMVRDGNTPASEAVWHIASAVSRPHFYIDVDPETCRIVNDQGIPTLLLTVPKYLRPEWNQPQAKRSWDVVVDEIEARAMQKSEATWGDL